MTPVSSVEAFHFVLSTARPSAPGQALPKTNRSGFRLLVLALGVAASFSISPSTTFTPIGFTADAGPPVTPPPGSTDEASAVFSMERLKRWMARLIR